MLSTRFFSLKKSSIWVIIVAFVSQNYKKWSFLTQKGNSSFSKPLLPVWVTILSGRLSFFAASKRVTFSSQIRITRVQHQISTAMKKLIFIPVFCLMAIVAQAQNDSVTIAGKVTDFDGTPIDSCTVCWMNESFETITQALTNSEGYYSAKIRKGNYNAVAAIYEPSYAHNALNTGLPENEHRLEFWAWNFIADRDTILNIRYHRMEAYGIHSFYIPGAVPTFQIYVRPMSLTRTYDWMKKKKPKSLVHGEDLSKITQQPVTKKAKSSKLSPSTKEIGIRVWIDGEEVELLQKQEINEYVSANEIMNAYLLTVNRPTHNTSLPYWVIKVELKDLKNGDCGEGIYYMVKNNYME